MLQLDNLKNTDLWAGFNSKLKLCHNKGNLKALLLELCADIGMDGVTWWFGIWPDYIELDTRPVEWMKLYEEKNLVFTDPIFAQSAFTHKPFLWDHITSKPQYGRGGRKVMGLAGDFGISHGVHFPVHTLGEENGCLSFYTDHRQTSIDVWNSLRVGLLHIAVECQRFSQDKKLLTSASAAPEPILNGNERETLILTARGMTSYEIAQHLDASEHTIKTRQRTIRKKLGVANNVEASVKAVTLNEIKY